MFFLHLSSFSLPVLMRPLFTLFIVASNEAKSCSKTFRRLRHFQFVNWTLDKNFPVILERFSKPNIRFGSGRTGSKIVSKFRLTHNRKLRSANRNTIYHTIASPALRLWCLAVENRGPYVSQTSVLCQTLQLRGDSFCQVLDHW